MATIIKSELFVLYITVLQLPTLINLLPIFLLYLALNGHTSELKAIAGWLDSQTA